MKAFTLVEVVFVIVILGILSAVAIPRLMTSRDDAKMAVALAEMGMIVSEIGSYYTTIGEFSENVFDMTSVENLVYTTAWDNALGEGVLTYSTSNVDDSLEPCVLISLRNQEGNVTVSNINNPSSSVCEGLQGHFMYQKLLGTTLVGGNRVQF
jgi:general secretion pathway protein G